MKSGTLKYFSLFLAFTICPFLSAFSGIKSFPAIFDRLLIEYAEKPINIDIPNPRFSWVISADNRNCYQTAYQLLVAGSEQLLEKNESDCWDSGKITSSETAHHEYHGIALKSNQKYFWKVIIWDNYGLKSESPVSMFETALLDKKEWQAKWIGKGPAFEPKPEKGFYGSIKDQEGIQDSIIHNGRSLLIRKEIYFNKKIKSAKAFVSGLGFYEFFINGEKVGNFVLTPAKTPYHKHILYDTYDVTKYLKLGENVLGFHLGNGWYNPYKKWWNQYRMQWFGHKKAIAQIHLTFEDGTTDIICSDKTWTCTDGPVLYNCVYDGEVYDANQEKLGWANPGYIASNWKQVCIFESVKAELISQKMPPIKVVQIIIPAELKSNLPRVKVYDMGQNFTGWFQILASGQKNTRLKIRFAEDIFPDGNIDPSSNEHAKATAEYIMKGSGTEVYEPSFTYFGFRYVEVSSDQPFDLKEVCGKVVHSANRPSGEFNCSNELVNRLHKATVWSQKSNMLGYPMDCPQRDERLGWLGDAQVSAEQAMFNFDMALFYRNWFRGIKDNQNDQTGDLPIISPQPYMPDEGIEWSSTYLIMIWQFYLNYGDQRILQEHYPAMNRYMDFLARLSKNHILPMGWIGDWGSMVKSWKEGQPESVPTAFYIWNARIMANVASVLGKTADANKFSKLEKEITAIYNQKYLNPQTGNYLSGSQMDNAFPLFLNIVTEAQKSNVLKNLVDDIMVSNQAHLTTGVLGTKYMPEALAQLGHHDVVWKLINQKTYPGWNQMMEKYTTVCEFWTLKQSKNHVMMGSIDAWFYKYLAGIQWDENYPGWSHFLIQPAFPEGLNFTQAKVETIKGRISSAWVKTADQLELNVEIPFNTSANVSIPGEKEDRITENGVPVNRVEGVEYLGYSEGKHRLKVNSGKYIFEVHKR